MRSSLLSGLAAALGAFWIGGCQPKPEAPAPEQPPVAAVPVEPTAMRATVQAMFPNDAVGLVSEVSPDLSVAIVMDAPVSVFKGGEDVIFSDAQTQVPVARGQVVRVVGDALHVRYTAKPDGRAPQQGDLAIHFRPPGSPPIPQSELKSGPPTTAAAGEVPSEPKPAAPAPVTPAEKPAGDQSPAATMPGGD